MINKQYSEFLLQMLSDNKVGKNIALDFGCGSELRHSYLLTQYFDIVHAADKITKKDAITNHLFNSNDIKVFYDNHFCKDTYDLIGFFWPEVPYYSFFIESVLEIKDVLKTNGKILFVMREYQNNTNELDFTSIYYKYLIIDHQQKQISNEVVIPEIEKFGMHCIDQRYFFSNDCFEINDLSQEIKLLPSSFISDDEKKRFINYKENGIKGKTGNIRFLLFE